MVQINQKLGNLNQLSLKTSAAKNTTVNKKLEEEVIDGGVALKPRAPEGPEKKILEAWIECIDGKWYMFKLYQEGDNEFVVTEQVG